MRHFKYRMLPGAQSLVVTPLYVDDALLSEIVLGDRSQKWRELRRTFERHGMPPARGSGPGLYYLPAQLRFLDSFEGIAKFEGGYQLDGPDNFEP